VAQSTPGRGVVIPGLRLGKNKHRQRYAERRYKTIRSADLWSVLKLSAWLYLITLITVLIAGTMLWWAASAAGIFGNVEQLFGLRTNTLRSLSWNVLLTSTLIGLAIVCTLTVLTVFAAGFYNLVTELLGGVEVTVVEEEELHE
jgi:phosphotransferase system  glucose/maltose/N-acetylglucosamine-specific IIC component